MTQETEQEKRSNEFKRIFEAMPGRKVDKIRRIAGEILFCAPNTIRIYLCNEPKRVIPAGKLQILKKAIEPF